MVTRLSFEEELGTLHEQFTNMLSLTEDAIDKAIVALKTQDAELAQTIIDGDDEIDKVERKIEKLCLEIMVRQNPIARDLRRITSIFKLITDLERIADHAEDISEIVIRIKDQKYIKPLVDLPDMANKARTMVTRVIRSYMQRDVDMAYEVCADDDYVDKLYYKIYDELVEMIKGNPACADQAVALISIAKYVERIADHATNIAEWVVFNETGKHKRIG
ncbi:MAG: phosphate signaling complex protein PhoU [Eubacteriales bacterium]